MKKQLALLREQMKKSGVDVYLIPTADFHQSEYVGDFFKAREYITGFTGSAGTAVVTGTQAFLWTDGRYFLQAKEQLAGTGVQLMKMGEPGVPDMEMYLQQLLPQGGVLGFDGRVVSVEFGKRCQEIAREKKGRIYAREDLVGEIWKERPELPGEPVTALVESRSGESRYCKLARIREVMRQEGADVHLLTTLDDLCWLLNIRGGDVLYTPVVLAYGWITMDGMRLYTDERKFEPALREELIQDGIALYPYEDIYQDVENLEGRRILLDTSRLNYALYSRLPEEMEKIQRENPEILMKAVKNPTEIANIRQAQIKDSVAHIRFMKWLKEAAAEADRELPVTEMEAAEKLDEFRRQMGGFLAPSFAPISACGTHGAIIHYSATPESNAPLRSGQLFLTDTGAGYEEGSTDVTRTYVLGDVPRRMKEDFTLVLTSHLRLADLKFQQGCTGQQLDVLARQPFWEKGLDYRHGTGHGVGYLLSIHEGPQAFMWKSRKGKPAELEPGMVITDEPGIYIEGSHGIRLENELLVQEAGQTEYGTFLKLEPVTFVPFDLDGVLVEHLNSGDREHLNAYHQQVYEKTSPYLSEEERVWLRRYTRSI